MLLAGKTAVVYGGGGAVGGAVAVAFAREGARVFLTGRTAAPLDVVAQRIRTDVGTSPDVATVDVLDADAVETHADAVVDAAGGLDVTFNAVGLDHFQGNALVDLAPERFSRPLADRMTAQFVTARAAARRMVGRGSGVILMITATPARAALPWSASFGAACAAVEGFARSLAAEVGPNGVRVICLRSPGSPDAPGLRLAFEARAASLGTTPEKVQRMAEDEVLMRRLPRLAEVADVAAVMASDRTSAMTATVVNLTGGATAD